MVFFYGAGVSADGISFLVTEYLQLGALSATLYDTSVQLDWDVRTRFALEAAEGMRYLHARRPPFLHRDLKTANILLSERWVAKVADFGTSRFMHGAAACTAAASGRRGRTRRSRRRGDIEEALLPPDGADVGGNFFVPLQAMDEDMTGQIGTLVYAAPEVLQSQHYGTAADVFSFAIVMFVIAQRERPYEGVKAFNYQLEDMVVAGQRPVLSAPCPGQYRSLMAACWCPRPSSRPSFNEIVQGLARILQEYRRVAAEAP